MLFLNYFMHTDNDIFGSFFRHSRFQTPDSLIVDFQQKDLISNFYLHEITCP